MTERKKVRIGIAGFGSRAYSFVIPLLSEEFRDRAEIIGVFDCVEAKLEFAREALQKETHAEYFTDLAKLLAKKPDLLLITTPQSAHAETAIAALEAGIDVFLEKPMARTAAECLTIIKAEKRTGKRVFMGFNLRFHPVCCKILELIRQNRIGRVQQIICTDFFSGGYTYFRRWHRFERISGGLTVEKGCHSIDQINRFAGSVPVRVAAFGGLDRFLPDPEGADYCVNCTKTATCPFYMDMNRINEEILQNTGIEGVVINAGEKMDLCVFNSEKDTCDNTNIIIEYANGTRGTLVECFTSSVSLTTGRQFVLNGWDGQIWSELRTRGLKVYDNTPGKTTPPPEEPEIPKGSGRHGGADNQMLDYVLETILHDRPNTQMRTEDGYYAVAVAEAAERSVREHRMIEIPQLEK